MICVKPLNACGDIMTSIQVTDICGFFGVDKAKASALNLPMELLVTSVAAQKPEGAYCFVKSEARLPELSFSRSIVVCGADRSEIVYDAGKQSIFIFTTEPRDEYFYCLATFCSKSVLGDENFIRTQSCALVHNSATVSPDATLGVNTVIHPNCVIYDNVEIAANCIIGPGCVVGYSGFGVVKDKSGRNLKVPHLGGVRIDEHCNIGALNTICSGTLDPTVVGAYTCTDDHVHIAHNVQIGVNCILTACAELSGSVTVGNDVWIGPNASIKNGLTIGDNAFIGIASNIIKNVAPNTVVAGNPGKVF